MPSASVSYLHCFLATCIQGDSIGFCKFYSDFLVSYRSQTLVNSASLDSLRCVVYFYSRLNLICAMSNYLEKDKCWHLGCSYGYLSRPVGSIIINHRPIVVHDDDDESS